MTCAGSKKDCAAIKAGELKNRIALESYALAPDGYGGSTPTWTAYATTWAKIEPKQGRERRVSEQIEARITHKITIRHRTGVEAKHRVNFGGRLMNILAVLNPMEENRILILMCEEGGAT